MRCRRPANTPIHVKMSANAMSSNAASVMSLKR